MALSTWTALAGGTALAAALTACSGPAPLPDSGPTASPESPVSATVLGDPSQPCTLLSAADIDAALGTTIGSGAETTDTARQISTCRFTTDDMTGIVDVGVSQIDGAESFETNLDLAPAYFGSDPRSVAIPGADRAYVVIAETYDAPVIGMLVNGNFVLLQVGVEGTTPQQGEELASLVASRL